MVDISSVYWQHSVSNHPQWYIFMCTEARASAFITQSRVRRRGFWVAKPWWIIWKCYK